MKQYKTDLLDIRCMDCMELMAQTPDKYYSLCIVDPPYGIGAGDVKFKNGSSKSEKPYFKVNDWDKKRPSPEYFAELRRVSREQIIWGGNYFSDLLPAFRCFVFWDKQFTETATQMVNSRGRALTRWRDTSAKT